MKIHSLHKNRITQIKMNSNMWMSRKIYKEFINNILFKKLVKNNVKKTFR